MANQWLNNAWGIDVSQYVVPDAAALQNWVDHGCSFLIAKCGDGQQITKGDAYDPRNYVDPTFAQWCQLAYDVKYKGRHGLPFMGYYFFRGNLPQEPDASKPHSDFQFRVIYESLRNKACCAMFLDFELKDDSNSNLSKKLHQLYNWINGESDFNPMWRGIYTNMNTLNYAVDVVTWLGSKTNPVDPLWMAQWPYAAGQKMTWETFRNFWPNETAKLKTPGYAGWKLWQILGDCAGLYPNALDFNLFNGNESQMMSWAAEGGWTQRDITPIPPPTPEPDPEPTPTPDYQALLDRLKVVEDKVAVIETKVSKIKDIL